MAYTPAFEQAVSAYVRRVAWALRMPMTVTLDDLVLHLAERTDPEKVCPPCRDNSLCSAFLLCFFTGRPPSFGIAPLSALITA